MDSEDSVKLNEELRMLLPVIVEDIERAKQWQWTLFLQVLTGQAVLATLPSFLPDELKTAWLGVLLLVLSIGLMALGVKLILQARVSLARARTRNAALRAFLEARMREILGPPALDDKLKLHPYMIAIIAIATSYAWTLTYATMLSRYFH